MARVVEVKTAVEIPPFVDSYSCLREGFRFLRAADVQDYLWACAERFDDAHAHADIARALRAVHDEIAASSPRASDG